MKFKMKREELLDNLNKVSKAISVKNLIPTLAGIKFNLKKDKLILCASNNDIVIQKTIIVKDNNIKIDKEGTVVIQGKDILDIVRIIPDDEINFEVIDEVKVLIYTDDERIKYDLNVIDINEYPNFDLEESDKSVEINVNDFFTLIKEIGFAISSDETRPLLTGINFKINGDIFEGSATNSYRLAKKSIKLDKAVTENYDIIVPGKNVIEFTRILDAEEDKMKIFIFNNKVLFKDGDLLFQSRLINGSYPNTSKLIPDSSFIKIVANLSDFRNVIEQASVLTSDKEKNEVLLSTDGDLLVVKSISNEKGKAEMKMKIEKDNDEDMSIAFSAKYMLDALNALSTEKIEISLLGEIKPIVIRNSKEDGLVQLVVPIRTY